MKKLNDFYSFIYTTKGMLIVFFATVLLSLLSYSFVELISRNEEERFFVQLYGTRAMLIVLLFVLLPGALLRLKPFFSHVDSAKNLAIFRIIFFGFFLLGSVYYIPQLWQTTVGFAELPTSSRVDLPLMSWYPKVVPFTKTWITLAIGLFGISTLAATIGYRTRLFIPLFVISAFYLLGIPNFYGKVNHNHDILWISAILAFSPCNHAYSLDVFLGRVRIDDVNRPHKIYAQALRLIWILIGIMYFFPGFWKMWSCGLDWALTDNVRNHFYAKWFELGGNWLPFFRIDSYPLLYKGVGLFTLLFEFFFIFWLFNKSTRLLGVVCGVLFHLGTLLFMNIFFVTVIIAYTSFIPWIGRRKQSETTTTEAKNERNLTMRIGLTLFAILILHGIGRIHSWPFSVYPTFDTLVETHSTTINYELVFADREIYLFDKNQIKEIYRSERLHSLEQQMIQNYSQNKIEELEELAKHLCRIIKQINETEQVEEIRVLLHHSSIIPNERLKGNDKLLFRFTD